MSDKKNGKKTSNLVRFSVCMTKEVEQKLLKMCKKDGRKKSQMISTLIKNTHV